MDWDRSKQTYFILRRGDPWSVVSVKGDNRVCEYPAYLYNNVLIEKICFAADDATVLALMEEYYKDHPEKRPKVE